jgi:hypothetical protein
MESLIGFFSWVTVAAARTDDNIFRVNSFDPSFIIGPLGCVAFRSM